MLKHCPAFLHKAFVITLALVASGVLNIFLLPQVTQPVKADNFYSSGGNVNECAFASTLGLQYNSLGGNGISWNSADVSGQSGNWIQSNTMNTVADTTFPDARRYENYGHYVAVPPNTRVEVGFFAWNYSGHNVNVDGVRLFTSYTDPARGDITRLGAGGTYGTHCANGFGCRGGKSVMTASAGNFANRTDYGGRIIYSFDTIQPMQYQSFTATPQWSGGSLTVRYDLTLRNVSTYNLNNIRVVDTMPSGATHDQTYNFSAGQTRTITYYDNMGTNYPGVIVNNPARVYDPNRHYERASDAYSGIHDNNPETRPAFAMRDDSNSPAGWNAPQPSWGATGGGLFAVELIPYNFLTASAGLNVSPQITHQKHVRDLDEDWSNGNTITPSLSDESLNEFDYRIRVTNNGGVTRDGVEVVDDYDQDLIEILDAAGGIDNGDTITWSGFDLGNSETKEFIVRARVRMPQPHGIHEAGNTIATRVINAPDGTTTPQPSTTRTEIRTLAQNEIKKYVKNLTAVEQGRNNSGDDVTNEHGADANSRFSDESDVNVVAGDLLEYTLVYRNSGNASSPDTFVRDHLPRFVQAEDGSQVEVIRLEDWIDIQSHDFVLTPTASGWDILWHVGELEAGEDHATKTFRVRVNPNSNLTLSLENTNRLVDNISEIYSSNESIGRDEDNAVIRVDQPNAAITKGSDRTIYQSDEEVVYAINVTNNGSSRASGVIHETLPDGLVFAGSNPEATRIDGQNLEWDVILEAGQEVDIELRATFTRPVVEGSVHNNLVEFLYRDINENERPTVRDEFEVEAHAPLLEIEKLQDLPSIVAPGQPIDYTIIYRNNGQGYAPNVTLTDTIPEHTTFVEVVEDELNPIQFVIEEDQIIWDLGQLDAGAEGSVTFKVVINIPTQSGIEIRNTAVIYSPVIEEIESEVVTAISQACCAGGNIWEDKNKNGQLDDNEKGIAGINVNISWQESEYLPENSIDIETDVNGHYSHQGLPYFVPITFTIEKPDGFDEITTANSYTVALLPEREDGVKEDYVRDGIRYVTADGCLEFMNTGFYRDLILAQTGNDITPNLITGVILIATGFALIYMLLKYRKPVKKLSSKKGGNK